jgi:hypothetical protein
MRFATTCLVAVLMGAPAAQATTVSQASGPVVVIEDTAGEADNLVVSGGQQEPVTVTSAINPITAGAQCTQFSPTVVVCPSDTQRVEARLAGGVDTIRDDTPLQGTFKCGGPGPSGVGGDTAIVDLADPDPSGCEIVQRAAAGEHPTIQVTRITVASPSLVIARLKCPRRAAGGCKGAISIRRGKRSFGDELYELRSGQAVNGKIDVTRRLPRRAEIRTVEKDSTGLPETTITRFEL